QGLEARLHEVGDTAAEHALLTEEVGLGLLGEGRRDDTGAGTTDALGVGLREVPGAAGGVLLDGDDVRDAPTVDELAAHGVPGSLRRDEDDVDTLRRLDVAVADVEAVAE